MADLKSLAEQIVNLTLLEAQELKQILKDEYGIEPAAGGAVMMAGPAAGGAAAPAEEEKTEFDVVLTDAGLARLVARLDEPLPPEEDVRGERRRMELVTTTVMDKHSADRRVDNKCHPC